MRHRIYSTRRGVVALALCLALPGAARSSEGQQIIIPLSRPGEPGTLSIGHYKGSITVTGHEGKSVIIDGTCRRRSTSDGMQSADTSIRFDATEKDNRIIVDAQAGRRTVDLDINVPQTFSLNLSTHDNGDIRVANVTGDLEINNVNGNIQLSGVSGSAILYSVEGNLDVSFRTVADDAAYVFTTVEGKIDLTFPAYAKASLKMKTDHGEIFHDDNLRIEKRRPTLHRSDPAGAASITLDGWTRGTVGGGGTDILLKTVNGDIFIRKAE